MIKIEDFARLSGVSVVTLRYYDEEGLLMPCYVHPDSGYRYFESGQLRQIRQILLLKELGFTLPEIRVIQEEVLSPDEMRRLLMTKRAESKSRVVAASIQIKEIDDFLANIDKENPMPHIEIFRKTVQPLMVASIHLLIPTNDQVPALLQEAYRQLAEEVRKGRFRQNGPCLAIWHNSPKDLIDESVDAAIPIDSSLAGGNDDLVSTLPEVEVISAVHKGPFSEFQQCHVVLSEWLSENGFPLDGPYREIYHEHDEKPSTTEVQYPIAKD